MAQVKGQRVVRFTLRDADAQDDDLPELNCWINVGPLGIEIGFAGYGECTAAEGHGTPVYIELVGSTPRVIVWADINQEDPTHNINLVGAQEAKRQEKNVPHDEVFIHEFPGP